MRIALVLGGNEDGGLENHTLQLASGLAATDEVHLIAHPRFRDRAGAGIHFHGFDMTRSRRDPRLLWALLKRLRALRADILHAQGGKATALVASLAPLAPGARVATVHNTDKSPRGLARFHGVIGVSKAIVGQIQHPRTRVIYNGVSSMPSAGEAELQGARALWPGDGEQRRWLAVGRLVPAKGFDTLIDAFRDVPGSLVIAGEGPQRGTLEQQIEARDLGSRIRLLGHRNDIGLLMSACDAVAISSRREGFSYVFAEALIARKPTVSTDVPVANEVLPQSLLCPVDNPAALAKRMRALDPDSSLPREAKAQADNMTLKAMLDRTRDFYQQILDADVIDLSDSQPFAEGDNRWCFRHPSHAERCLKVMKPGVVEQRFAARPGYRRLRGRAAADDNRQEAAAYRQRAIRQGGERIWDHLPRFHGVHQTTLGPANETDFIAVDDAPAPTLDSLLARRGLDDELSAALREFSDWLRQTELLTRNLLPHNLVFRQGRLYLIDGIAPPFSARVLGISRRWRRYWVERRIRRMWRRVQWEAEGRSGTWESVEAEDRQA